MDKSIEKTVKNAYGFTLPAKAVVKNVFTCDILAKDTAKMRKALEFNSNGQGITTGTIEIGPMPVVIELELSEK